MNHIADISPTFLVLTKLEKFQDNSLPNVYLGEWCLTLQEKLSLKNHNKTIIQHPLFNKKNSLHGYNNTKKYMKRYYHNFHPGLIAFIMRISLNGIGVSL